MWKTNFYGFVHDIIYGKAQLLRYKTGQTDCDIQPPQTKICLTFMNTFKHFTTTRNLPKSSKMFFHTKTYKTFKYHWLEWLHCRSSLITKKKKKTRKTISSLRNQVAINKPTQLQICCIANNTLASMHSMIPSFHNSARPERLEPQVMAEIKWAAQSFICLCSMKKGDFCF